MPKSAQYFTKDSNLIYPELNRVQVELVYDFKEPNYNQIFKQANNLSKKDEFKSFFDKNLSRFAAKPIYKLGQKEQPTSIFLNYK